MAVTRTLFDVLDEALLYPLIGRTQMILEDSHRRNLIRNIMRHELSDDIEDVLLRAVTQRIGGHKTCLSVFKAASLYRQCFNLLANFALRPTVRYSAEPEFTVVATQSIPSGVRVYGLSGVLIPIPMPWVELSPKSIRSVIRARHIKGESHLAGPISCINHRCQNYNAKFMRSGKDGMDVWSIRSIAPGETITVNYAPHYFGPQNEDCLCVDCEDQGIGGWQAANIPMSKPGHLQTRIGSSIQKKRLLELRRFTYDSIVLPEEFRIPGDHFVALVQQTAERCIAKHCQMLFVGLQFGYLCLCCQEQIRAHEAQGTILHRYYAALLSRRLLLGPYHTKDVFKSTFQYLQQLEIPGWRIYARAVRFNNQKHKLQGLTQLKKAGSKVDDIQLAATVDGAAAAGALQSGQIWLLVGDWRPENASTVVKFRYGDHPNYTCVVLLRNQRIYIMDPCFEPSLESDTVNRLGSLQSLHRARTLVDVLGSRKRKVSLKRGIRIGTWQGVSILDEFDFSSFACFEFLEAMKREATLREDPELWAREEIAR